MRNWGTKKNVLLIGFIGSFLLISLGVIVSTEACYHNKWCFRFFDNLFVRTFAVSLLSFLPLLLLSLITYKLRDEIFTAWIRFAKWWIPLTILATIIAPSEIPGTFSVPVKGPLVLALSGTFLVISLAIILYKSWKLKGTDTKA